MANRSICFDKRQKATVLAALYLYRDADLDQEEAINRIATQGWEEKALIRHEIDELIMEIMETECEVEPVLAVVDIESKPATVRIAPRWLPIGEVSSGSHKLSDQFKAVLEFAQRFRRLSMDFDKAVTNATQHWVCDFDANSKNSYLAHIDLMDALQTVCPPFCYFGANEGDGSSIGVWVSDDAIDEALRNKTMVKVDSWLDVYGVSPTYDWVLDVGKYGLYQKLFRLENGMRVQVWET
jgi:hypothetical protein